MKQDDENTTIEELKSRVRAFCEERNWSPYHGPKDLAIGLVTEASELLEIFRFVRERELGKLLKNEKTRTHIADELADSLYFVLRFAEMYGFDLSKALTQKLVKNAKKYPAPE